MTMFSPSLKEFTPALKESEVVQNALARATHFGGAMDWIAQSIEKNSTYQKLFLELAHDLCACSRGEEAISQTFFMAVGKSAQVGSLVVSMLVSVGILARFVHPTEAFHGDFGVVGKQDIVVLISNGGKTAELIQLVPSLKARGVKTYLITSQPQSPLAEKVDRVLLIPPFAEMCPLSQAPITSPLSTLALCQLLVASTIELRDFPIEEYAKNHPGGAIGKRIFIKVEDLMHKGENLPHIEPEAIFLKLVSEFTRYSKAGILVTQGHSFLGLITERDIRKAMEKYGPKVFELCAKDIMNTKCTTIFPSVLAVSAMKKMLDHKPPFNLLPVVSESGEALGLIHMQDFLTAGISVDHL
jgi:arabinose-5-phosphate isomerase